MSLTDIAKYKNSEDPRMVITNWMSSYSTIDFLAVWEEIHNSNDFNRLEFQSVRNERGRLIMTPKQWIERMQAKGIISKAGKYGGTYAHSDIAFEFASWISQGLSQQERLQKLRSVAYKQTEILKNNAAKRNLGNTNPNLLKGGDKDAD
ncbi:KilA-N domain-containing protein [Butyrivibrio sp. WCE2006]|uniref:KilA-N domain-containing protein n=2 Tax=unclassified Butyrivibrio TaxID=2639466 RepID=UPI002101A43F|nr:KilA-N domain-containing protein [Butyrivibrio sp. WCE2006]